MMKSSMGVGVLPRMTSLTHPLTTLTPFCCWSTENRNLCYSAVTAQQPLQTISAVLHKQFVLSTSIVSSFPSVQRSRLHLPCPVGQFSEGETRGKSSVDTSFPLCWPSLFLPPSLSYSQNIVKLGARLLRSILPESRPAFCYSKTIHSALQPPPEVSLEKTPLTGSRTLNGAPSLVHGESSVVWPAKQKTSMNNPDSRLTEDSSKELPESETQRVRSSAIEKFPYSCPPSASVRIYHPEKKPWWKVLLGGIFLSFFIIAWLISSFFPLYVIYRTSTQLRDIYRYRTQTEVEAPEVILFFGALLKTAAELPNLFMDGMRSVPRLLLCSSINTSQIISTISRSWRSSTERFSEIMNCLDWQGHLCLGYIMCILIMNVKDLFKTPNSIPVFVKTADGASLTWIQRLRIHMARGTFDWFLPGSAILFEDYRSFVVSGRFGNPPTLMCYHPHGILSFGLFYLLSLPEMDGYRLMGAPFLKYFSPLFRLIFSNAHVALGSVDKVSFKQSMEAGESMVLVPGGIHEATISEYGKECVYLKNRKGFIRYSLQYGYSVTPVYSFGENICYNHLFSNALHRIKFWLNSKGIPTVLPFGSLWWPFGLLPNRVPSLVVVGAPLNFPMIRRPTAEDVDLYHHQYITEISRLYVTYAESYYQFCKDKYGIEVPPQTPEGSTRSATSLPNIPSLQVW